MFLTAAYFYNKIPDKIASHWNVAGEVNGYMCKFWGIFLLPLISVGIFILFLIIPFIEPLKENLKKFRKYYDFFRTAILGFLFYIYLLTIFWNINQFNFTIFLVPAFSILIYCAGILIDNAKRNWFVGIRTPWTLSSDKVWNSTHKLGGILFKIAAVISLLGLIFPNQIIFLLVFPIIGFSVFLVFYSFFKYKQSHK